MSTDGPAAGSGFFYIPSRPKPEFLQEYHDWYNTEHGPLRLKLDFFLNGYRYRCIDPDDPTLFCAVYDLSRLSGLEEEQYTSLRSTRSAQENAVFDKKLAFIDRRVYKDIGTYGDAPVPAPVIMVVAFVVKNELVPEVHQWYEEVR